MNPPHLSQRRKLRQLHRRCHARLATLDLDRATDIRAVCVQVAERRGRPIQLLPVALGAASPSGCWIAVGDADFIVYDANTSTPHQEHIIAHELAHMICRHRGAATLDGDGARLLFPGLDPALVRDMLGRTGYPDHQEEEAEILATLLLGRLRSRRPADAERAPVVKRIRDSLA